MKSFKYYLFFLLITATFFTACDKVKNDIKPPDTPSDGSPFELGIVPGKPTILNLASIDRFSDAISFKIIQQTQFGKTKIDQTILIYSPDNIKNQPKDFTVLETTYKGKKAPSQDTIIFNPNIPVPSKDSTDCDNYTLYNEELISVFSLQTITTDPIAFHRFYNPKFDNREACIPWQEDSVAFNNEGSGYIEVEVLQQPKYGTIKYKGDWAPDGFYFAYFSSGDTSFTEDYYVYKFRRTNTDKYVYGAIKIKVIQEIPKPESSTVNDTLYYNSANAPFIVDVFKNDIIYYEEVDFDAYSLRLGQSSNRFIKPNYLGKPGLIEIDYSNSNVTSGIDTIYYTADPKGKDLGQPRLYGILYVFFP